MRFQSIILLVVALVTSVTQANAAILTFNVAPQVTTTYTEAGFTFTISPNGTTNHFGDGAGATSSNLSWHDGPANASGMIVTLTQVGGGTFDLNSFDLTGLSSGGSLLVTGAGPGINYTSIGTKTPGFLGVTSVTFDVNPGGASVSIDNVNVNASAAVPEPASLAIWGGLGIAGLVAARRRKKIAA